MPLIPVQTLDDPRLVVFRDVKATRHSKWKGRFITEGARLAKRLLATDYVVESMLLTEGRVEEFSSWLRPDVPTFVMPQTLAAELIGYNFHCGAMACALRKPNPSLDEIMARGGERMTFVVCPDVNDPENIGTLIRLGAAFGIDALDQLAGSPDAADEVDALAGAGIVHAEQRREQPILEHAHVQPANRIGLGIDGAFQPVPLSV